LRELQEIPQALFFGEVGDHEEIFEEHLEPILPSREIIGVQVSVAE
jgi:hypothetical protein